MKYFLVTLFTLAGIQVCDAQILKRIGSDIKNTAEHKARQKINQQVDKTLDSIVAKPQKQKNKKENSGSGTQTQPASHPSSTIKSTGSGPSVNQETGDEMSIGEGFVKLYVSANEVFTGGTIVLTGNSVKYNQLNEVKIEIRGPLPDNKTLKLLPDGSFTGDWQAEQSGEYTITAKSSDGKSFQSAKINVLEMELTDWEPNEAETDKAINKLRKEVDRVQQNIG